MIRTLQKKFIVTAMIAVTVLLVVLLGAVNVVNAWSSRQDTERLLRELVQMEAEGRKPGPGGPADREGDAPETLDQPPALPEGESPEGRGGFFGGRITENDRMAALYFSVRVKDGAILSADVSRISSVTAREAEDLATEALASGAAEGRVEDYRWASRENDSGETVCVFLENSARRNSVLRVAVLSALAGLAGWGLMLLLVVLLSKKAIAPIAANMERQRQFVTDAGHELKTPLAIIQANTEAMELITGENKWSRNIKLQVVRLTDLTRNLLTLARAEEVPSAGSFTRVDLSALAEQTAQMFSSPMELRGLRLKAEIPPELFVRGNQSQLATLCSILMDNAVKYAAQGTELTLRLRREDRQLRLRLENDCEALPACPPEQLFDRFYRADAARTQSGGGFGIGLSAARVIAEAHKGRLEAEYLGEHRIAFTVSLPE